MASRKPPKKPSVPKRAAKEDFGPIAAKVAAQAAPLPAFEPLELVEVGSWDPKKDFGLEEGEPVPAWAKPIFAHGKRKVFELELVTPDDDGMGDGPILKAIELFQNRHANRARAALQTLLAKDIRCIDAHAHLGNFVFGRDPAAAVVLYATGATIGIRSLGAQLDDVVWWLSVENRPFLRCLHGVGLCWWRLGRADDAAALFRWMLWLNPHDNQGVRILLEQIADGHSWAELHGEQPPVEARSPRGLPRTPAQGRRSSRAAREREWVGGFAPMPAFVASTDDHFQPEIAMWVDEELMILGSTMGKKEQRLDLALEALHMAMTQPLVGRPARPTRLRVDDDALADAVHVAHPDIEIVRGPTPEIDAVLESMRDHFAGPAVSTHLSPGIPAAAMKRLFDAAAAFYRAAPWRVLKEDLGIVGLTSRDLELDEAVISVMGELGQSFGFIVFASADDFEAYVDAAQSMGRRRRGHIPAHLALNFDRGAELAPALRKEIAAQGWDVASAAAYPVLTAVDKDLAQRPPTARDVRIADAVARGLTSLVGEKKAMRAALRADRCFSVGFDRVGDMPDLVLRTPFD